MRQGIVLVGVLAAAFLAASAGYAAEQKAFTHTLAVGATYTDGNSDTRQGNVTWLTEGDKEGLGSIRFGAEGNYGESRGSDGEMGQTIGNAKASANVKKTLSTMTFTYLDTTVLHDDIADIEYRFTVGPGLGFYLVKSEATQVSLEAGPSYVWEKVGGQKDDYAALRVAERVEHKLSETAKVWESAEYLAKMDDFSKYLINSEAGIEAAMNAKLSLRLVLQNAYNSEPADGKEKSDTTVIVGVSVKL